MALHGRPPQRDIRRPINLFREFRLKQLHAVAAARLVSPCGRGIFGFSFRGLAHSPLKVIALSFPNNDYRRPSLLAIGLACFSLVFSRKLKHLQKAGLAHPGYAMSPLRG